MADQNLLVKILIDAQDRASSVFGTIKNSLMTMAGAATAALGTFSAGAFLKGAIDDAVKLDEQTRKLEQVIKATGSAANLTADDIKKMFQNEGNAAEFNDAAAQLLTFKSVGKDVFETTLRLAEDLSEAGFGGLSENAVRLGKALEDPADALGALTRVGVTFTGEQKKLIESLVETGDKASAQKVILEAVAGQVGGVAAAMEGGIAGAQERMQVAFRRMSESIGGLILPKLSELALKAADASEKLTGLARDGIASVSSGFSQFGGALQSTGVVVVDLIGIKLVNSLLASSKAFVDNAIAARQAAAAAQAKAIADKEAIATEQALSAVRVKAALARVEELRAQVASVAGTEKEIAAKKALVIALEQLHAAQAKQAAANASIDKLATSATAAERAMAGLNGAFSLLLAYDIGKSIGEWARQFDFIKSAGVRVAEVFTIMKTGAEGMFSGVSLSDRLEQIKQIHEEFNAIAADQGDNKATAAEDKKTQATAQTTDAVKQQAAAIASVGDNADAAAAKVAALNAQIAETNNAGPQARAAEPAPIAADNLDAIAAKRAALSEPINLIFAFPNFEDTMAKFDAVIAKASEARAAVGNANGGGQSTEQALSNEALKFGSVTE